MLLYKNGRIYEIEKKLGETRHEFMMRCWFMVNAASTESDALAWISKNYKGCSYGDLNRILDEKSKELTQ